MANEIADWPRVETMKSLARRAFLILEKAWKRLNVTLVDFKVNRTGCSLPCKPKSHPKGRVRFVSRWRSRAR